MFSLDLKGGKPIYEQIIEQMKKNISKGYLRPGDSIPSVRKMALELSVTPGTVAKAYQQLEREKLIETFRGKGTFIAKSQCKVDDDRLSAVREHLSSEILELKMMGFEKKEIKLLIDELFDEV